MTIQEIAEVVKGFSPLIISTVALFITWRYNLKNRELANDKMMKEIFLESNNRYDRLNDFINLILSIKTEEEVMNFYDSNSDTEINGITKSLLLYKINDYFNLCAEEYYWKKKGRIDDTIWYSWEVGMNRIYNESKIIQSMWMVECKNEGFKSYYIDKPNAFFKNAK